MNTIVEHINSVGHTFVEFALPMLIQSSVLIVVLLLADLLLRKKVKAVFRYWIWMLVLVKLVLPTSLSSPLSLGYFFGDKLTYQDLAQTTSALESAEPAPAVISPGINPIYIKPNAYIPPTKPVIPGVEQVAAGPVSPPAVSVTPLSWQGVVFLVWLAVVIAMGLLLLQRALFVRGLVAQAREANRLMNDALGYCCERMGMKGKVGLKVSANATSPSVCGLIRPVILLPRNLPSSLGASRLRAVLMHELAHIKRGDLWVNLAQTVLQIVYFYNPLLWLANAIIRRVREQAIDETVLVAMGAKAQQYPQTLVDVARLAFKQPTLSLRLIGVVESKSALAGRIKHILGRPMPKSAKLGILSALAIIIIGAILLPMAKAAHLTDHTRQIMKLAKQEARQLNHEYIGTEHILLALVKEGRGVSGIVLRRLDVDIEKVRFEVRKLVRSGPEVVATKRLPKTPRAKRAMKYGIEESKTLGHDYVGAEHVLLGLLREKDGVAAQVLKNLGLELEDVRQEVLNVLGPKPRKGGYPTLVISGVVTDAATGEPIAVARVGDDGYGPKHYRGAVTDSDGRYYYLTWPEHHGIKAEADGYKGQRKSLYDGHFTFGKEMVEEVFDFALEAESRHRYEHFVGKYAMAKRPDTAAFEITKKGDVFIFSDLGGPKFEMEEAEDGLKFADGGGERFRVRYDASKNVYYLDNLGIPGKEWEPESILLTKISAEKPGDIFVATLPNGVTVELVGVCEHPSEGKQWWKPDGDELLEAPYDDIGGNVYPDGDEKSFEFAIILGNLPAEHVNTKVRCEESVGGSAGGSSSPEKNGEYLSDFRWLATTFLKKLKACTVKVGVAAGQWQPVAESNGKRFGSRGSELGGVSFTKAFEVEDGISITVADDILGRPCRVVAITNDGEVVKPVRSSGSSAGKARQTTAKFNNTSLSEIKEFQFQTRPYEWVEFKNVSLQPGVKTDVQAEVVDNWRKVTEQTSYARLVFDDEDKITFQGQYLDDINDLSAMLANLPEPQNTVLEWAFAPGTMPEPKSMAWLGIAYGLSDIEKLVDKYGLKSLVCAGEQPLGSRGGAFKGLFRGTFSLDKEIHVDLQSSDGFVKCQSIKFEKTKNELKASLQIALTSYPKTKWESRLELRDAGAEEILALYQTFENSGIIEGFPLVSDETIQFSQGKFADFSDIDSFELRVRQVQDKKTDVQVGSKSKQAIPLKAFEFKLVEKLLDLVKQVEKQYPEQATHWPAGAGLYHIDAQGEVTVWHYRALWRRSTDCAPDEVGWGSSQLVNATGMYYLPDGTPLQSRWRERGDGMKDIRVKVGRTIDENERVAVIHRHSLPSNHDLLSRDGLERNILLDSWKDLPLAIIIRVDRPMRLDGWWLGDVETDSQHFNEYDQLIVNGPPGNNNKPMLVTVGLPETDVQVEGEEREVGPVSVIRAVDNKATLTNGVTVEQPATIRVPEDYPTAYAAVKAAKAGDTIVISADRYRGEDILIEPKLEIEVEKTSQSQFSTTLGSGLAVELLGLTEIPIKDNPWWKPNGSVLEQLPFDNVSFDPSRDPNHDQFAYYAVAMKLKGKAPDEIRLIKWNFTDALYAGTTSAYLDDKGVYKQNIRAAVAKFPKDVETTALRLGFASGDWQTLVAGRHYGFYRKGEDSIVVRTPERAGGPFGVRPQEKGLHISVTYNITDRDFRVVAVDKDGKVHFSSRGGPSGTDNLRQMTASFPELTRDELKEYRFQVRPHEWVEFEDISLRPGKEAVALTEKRRAAGREELEKWLGQGQTRRIREQILVLRGCRIFKEMEAWALAIRELVSIGKPAVPELLAELRRAQRWPTQSTVAFTLRAIADPRAVPVLIEVLGRVEYRGEYGIHLKDPPLSVFMLENQHRPAPDRGRKQKDPQITIGCPVIEITAALEKITGHTEGHEHYGHKAVAELGSDAPRDVINRRIQEIVREVAGRWQKWLDQNKDAFMLRDREVSKKSASRPDSAEQTNVQVEVEKAGKNLYTSKTWQAAFYEAERIIRTRQTWPETPEALAKAFWKARALKDYKEMEILWPGSGSWNWAEICKNDPAVNYVFGKARKDNPSVSYASEEYFAENQSYNLTMRISSLSTKKGKRYYITSGN